MDTTYSWDSRGLIYPTSGITRVRNHLVLSVLALYLLLNYGFMLIGMPLGNGRFPIGELFLLLFFVTTRHSVTLPLFVQQFLFLPYFFWLILGLGSAFLAVPNYGFWALRDATPVIESLFLYVGFVYAMQQESVKKLFELLPKFLILVVLYGFLFPWREILQGYAPKLTAAAGHQVPIFFCFTNTGIILLLAAVYLLLFESSLGHFRYWFAGAVFVYAIFFFQSRTVYLQVFAILVILFWKRRSALGWGLMAAIITTFISVVLIDYANVKIPGRLGYEISADFLREHFMAIYGQGKIDSAVGGVHLRLSWWREIYDRLTESLATLSFGLGYGIHLTKFKIAHGVIVREPHNSFISLVARLGLVGFTCFALFHVSLLTVWNRTYRWAIETKNVILQNRLLILLIYTVMICVAALGEDAFEKPFNAIPYYFFWGIVLGMNFQIKLGLSSNVTEPLYNKRFP